MTGIDPRVERTRQHVVACAREMLVAEGVQAITFSTLSRRARVSRSTLYQHWPTIEQVLVEVTLRYYLDRMDSAGPAPASTAAFLRRLGDSLRTSETREVLTALIAQAQRNRTSAEVLQQSASLGQQALEFANGPLTEAQVAQIVGPMFYQVVIACRPLDDAFVEELIAGLEHMAVSRGESTAAQREPGPDGVT